MEVEETPAPEKASGGEGADVEDVENAKGDERQDEGLEMGGEGPKEDPLRRTTDDLQWLASLPKPPPVQTALHQITTPLHAVSWKGLIEQLSRSRERIPRYERIPDQIKDGFFLGIEGPPVTTFVAPNAMSAIEHASVLDKEIKLEVENGWLVGPYTKEQLEEGIPGHFQTSPLGVVEKDVAEGAPKKYRIIENLSYPYKPLPEGTTSVNSRLDAQDMPCEWLQLRTLIDLMRRLGPESQVLVTDMTAAFRQLPIAPSQRPHLCVSWRGGIFVRTVPSFGGKTTPAVFGNVVDALTDIVQMECRGILMDHIVDDLLVVDMNGDGDRLKLDDLLEELGVRTSAEKTQLWCRKVKFAGLWWDLDRRTIQLDAAKARKYAKRFEPLVTAMDESTGVVGKVTKKEVLKALGTIFYVCEFVPTHRADAFHLLSVVRGFTKTANSFVKHHLGYKAWQEAVRWKARFETEVPMHGSLDLPHTFHHTPLWSDACEEGIGIVYGSRAAAFARLSPKWSKIVSEPGGIVIAEAWALEWLVELAIAFGIRDEGLKIGCDNLGVVGAWRKGRCSTNALVNRAIQRTALRAAEHGLFVVVTFVSTDANPADEVSRGRGLDKYQPAPEALPPARGSWDGDQP
ncbi:hypothetical protein JCM8115_004334 [Rhodotorula mucilaginosa]